MYMSFAYRFSVVMEICLYALFIILGLPTTFTGQPACRDNQEEFGFALVGHDYKSVYADHFSRCYFECTSEERCQSVTYLWDQKECKMNNETKKSRPEDYVQNPAAAYMENTFRGIVNQEHFSVMSVNHFGREGTVIFTFARWLLRFLHELS